ncbi:MAG: peptidylprolyl isomerase [Clostridia bacterium]|nr:peptidylprolyl isomerase [Clostridia bacterium]
MRRRKQWVIIGVIFMLLFTLITGCGKQTETAKLELIPQDMAGDVVASVNGEPITLSDMQYYIYNASMIRLYQLDPTFSKGIQGAEWNKKMDNGKTLEETVKDDALRSAAADILALQNGTKAGFDFPDEPKQQIENSMKKFLENYGEESFALNLTAMGISSGEAYVKLFERTAQSQNVREDIQTDIGKYITDGTKLEEYRNPEKATVQHVLIKSQGGKYEDAFATASEVYEKAKAGEDFVALIEEYNEDPGATETGYTFGPGEMVKEFEEASFALDYDEISQPVKTAYGYHVIKRLVGAAELENFWMSEAEIHADMEKMKKISVEDIMNTVDKAQDELRKQAKGE